MRDDKGGIVIVTDYDAGIVQRFSVEGNPLWSQRISMLQGNDSYYKTYGGDYHGGIIVTFWTTIGGIYAQHSGRDGQVGIITTVEHRDHELLQTFELQQNFPNPFNPITTITYSIPKRQKVDLSVYDIVGRKTITLVDQVQDAGTYMVIADFSSFASGIYFYRLESNSFLQTRKLLFIK